MNEFNECMCGYVESEKVMVVMLSSSSSSSEYILNRLSRPSMTSASAAAVAAVGTAATLCLSFVVLALLRLSYCLPYLSLSFVSFLF